MRLHRVVQTHQKRLFPEKSLTSQFRLAPPDALALLNFLWYKQHMTTFGMSTNIRIGLWIDDLRMGVKNGVTAAAVWKPEIAGLDAFGPEVSPRVLTGSGRRDLAQYVRSRGMVLAALRADVGGRRLADPQTLDVNISKLREAVQLGADLRAQHLVVSAGFVPSPDNKDDAVALCAISEAARTLASLSATSGVRICWLAGHEAPVVLRAFLDKHDPGGGLEADLNPGGYVMRGIDPLKALNELNARVSTVRGADNFRGGAEAPFGLGDVRWGEVIIGLSALKRPQPLDLLAACGLEGDRAAVLGGAVKRLQALRKNPLG
jgi:sugar phosphate isomerase/epimerase